VLNFGVVQGGVMVTFEKVDVGIMRKVNLKGCLEEYELFHFTQTIANRVLDPKALDELLNSFKLPNKFTY